MQDAKRLPEPIRSRNIAALALCVGVVLMAVKFVAYWLTDSAAVLSDALESIVNVFASGFALFSIMLSARPPDSSHPYGHGRVEFFSAGLEGMLIVVAAVAIFWHAVPRLLAPQPLSQLSEGIALVAVAGVVNALTGWYLQRVGHRTQSLAPDRRRQAPAVGFVHQRRYRRGHAAGVAYRLVHPGCRRCLGCCRFHPDYGNPAFSRSRGPFDGRGRPVAPRTHR